MDKAIRQNIDRRALLKGASIATMASAIPATVATAIGATPALAEDRTIDALLIERDRLKAVTDKIMAAMDRIEAAWPTVFAMPPDFDTAEERLAWNHSPEGQQRALDFRSSGYRRHEDRLNKIEGVIFDVEKQIVTTPATTMRGMAAKLAIIVRHIRVEFTDRDGVIDPDGMEIEHHGILSIADDFERLLPGSAVAS
jgi:hypothetical protein